MSSAFHQLLHSEKFRDVLRLVLCFGNFINNTSAARQSKLVYGVDMDGAAGGGRGQGRVDLIVNVMKGRTLRDTLLVPTDVMSPHKHISWSQLISLGSN